MKKYHKIQTVFKRDPDTNNRHLINGEFSIPEFEFLQNNTWIFTEKVDGTNIRVMLKDGALSFGGKTDNADIPNRLIEALESTFCPMTGKMVDAFSDGVCLYGEGYRAKIQSGGKYRFVLFDVKIGEWWLTRSAVEDIASNLGIECVPVIGEGTLRDMIDLCRNGIKSAWGDFDAEGIVAFPEVPLRTRRGDRIITKIKFKDFPVEERGDWRIG